MSAKPTGSRHAQPVRAVQRRAVSALFELWRAMIRLHIKRRTHRAPTKEQIEGLVRGLPAETSLHPLMLALRSFEQRIGKRGRDWSAEENREAAVFAHGLFEEYRSIVERPVGRPGKQRRGIVEAEMAKANRRYSRVPRSTTIVAWMSGYLHGTVAKREGLRTTEQVRDLVARYPDELPRRVPPGAWRELANEFFLDHHAIDAIKKRYSRARSVAGISLARHISRRQ